MSAITFFTNKKEITGLTHNNVFNDVDLSSLVSSSAVGVIVEILNSGAQASYRPYIRCNGSTDAITSNATIVADEYNIRIVKCDADKKIEIQSPHSDFKYYLTGELGSGAVLKTNLVDKTTGATEEWVDIDITSDLETGDSGDVEAVIVTSNNTSSTEKSYSIRKNGSTDSLTTYTLVINSWISGVDSNDVFEQYRGHANVNAYMVGYIKKSSGLTMKTNYTAKTCSTNNSWTDMDITSDTASNANGAILVINSASGELKYTRENGSTNPIADHSYEYRIPNFIGLDSSQILEYYGNSATIQLMGYTAPVSSSTAYDREVTGSLPAMAGALTQKVTFKRTLTGAI